MILLLGGSGYIGQAFARDLEQRKWPFVSLARKELDYTRFDLLLAWLKKNKPEFVVNAAGYTGKPNVDACEVAKADTLAGNTLLPQTIAHACAALEIPWGHVSSGCIYSGAKIYTPDVRPLAEAFLQHFSREQGGQAPRLTADAIQALNRHTWPGGVRELRNTMQRAVVLHGKDPSIGAAQLYLPSDLPKTPANGHLFAEKDMSKPEMKTLVAKSPEQIHGFTETDTPNFSFRDEPCSFYSGTKALGEEAINGVGQSYIWRLRIPFDEFDNARNYLSKVQRYAKAYDNVNSISHRADYVRACLDLWEKQAAFGIYNVTNPGFITTRQVIRLIEKKLNPAKRFEFWADDAEFYRTAAKTPRSNCVMDVSKLLAAGVKIRPVLEALEHSLDNWKPEAGAGVK